MPHATLRRRAGMYLSSAKLKMRAVNSATGESKWTYHPFGGKGTGPLTGKRSRRHLFSAGPGQARFNRCSNGRVGEPVWRKRLESISTTISKRSEAQVRHCKRGASNGCDVCHNTR